MSHGEWRFHLDSDGGRGSVGVALLGKIRRGWGCCPRGESQGALWTSRPGQVSGRESPPVMCLEFPSSEICLPERDSGTSLLRVTEQLGIPLRNVLISSRPAQGLRAAKLSRCVRGPRSRDSHPAVLWGGTGYKVPPEEKPERAGGGEDSGFRRATRKQLEQFLAARGARGVSSAASALASPSLLAASVRRGGSVG